MRKTLVTISILVFVGQSLAQNSGPLKNYRNKTHRELLGSPTSSTRLDTIIWQTAIISDSIISAIDNIGAFTSDYSPVSGAFTGVQDSGTRDMLFITPGNHTITDSLLIYNTLLIQGMGAINPRSGQFWQDDHPTLKVQINDGFTPAIRDTVPYAKFRDFQVRGDSTKTTGIGIKVKRPPENKTIGGVELRGIHVRDMDSTGVLIVAPDNGTGIWNSRIGNNDGYGVMMDLSANNKGLNPVIAWSRITANDNVNLYLDGIDHMGVLWTGILGAKNDLPLIEFSGGNRADWNVFMGNDLEPSADNGSASSAIAKVNNTQGTVWAFNRIGLSGVDSIAFNYVGAARSDLFLQNKITGYSADSVWVINGGSANILVIGDHNGVYGKDMTRHAGNGRWMHIQVERDSSWSFIDTGGLGAQNPLVLNPWAEANVEFFKLAESGENPMVYIYDYSTSAGGADTLGLLRGSSGDQFIIKALEGDLELYADSANVVVNENGQTSNFRVESDTKTAALFVDGADDRVGIMENNPKHTLSFYDNDPIFVMTDTEVNKNRGGAGQASDTSAIILNSNSTPQITIANSNGNTFRFTVFNDTLIAVTGTDTARIVPSR